MTQDPQPQQWQLHPNDCRDVAFEMDAGKKGGTAHREGVMDDSDDERTEVPGYFLRPLSSSLLSSWRPFSRGPKRLADGVGMGGGDFQESFGGSARDTDVLLPFVKSADTDADELGELGLAEAHGAADGNGIGITGIDRRCG